MYSTVINSHPTVIRHEVPQPKGVGVHPAASQAFSVDSAETLAMAQKQLNGSYSIPVHISGDNVKNELNGYEVPNFIHKKESKIKEDNSNAENLQNTDSETFLKRNMEQDINEFVAHFDNTKDKAERIRTCNIIYFKIPSG
jgi:hypothetical protein